jgi:hypothetical protein
MLKHDYNPPWGLYEHNESFEIRNSSGTRMVYIYFEDEPVRRGTMNRLTKMDAREIAFAILRVPEMMGWK